MTIDADNINFINLNKALHGCVWGGCVCACVYIYMLQNNKDSKVKRELESKKMWFRNNPVDSFFFR